MLCLSDRTRELQIVVGASAAKQPQLLACMQLAVDISYAGLLVRSSSRTLSARLCSSKTLRSRHLDLLSMLIFYKHTKPLDKGQVGLFRCCHHISCQTRAKR